MLSDAVVRGRIYQVKFLLESGSVNVNSTDEDGQTALTKAILLQDQMHRTRYKLVRCLLDHGAKVNIADKHGRNALMYTAICGLEDLAGKILQKAILDLDLNAEDNDGNTALLHAASRGYTSIVSLLINALKRFGLDLDKKNHSGMTPLLQATKNAHEKAALVLINEGDASLTIRDPEHKKNAREWASHHSLGGLLEKINEKQPIEKVKDEREEPDSVDSRGDSGTKMEDVNESITCRRSAKSRQGEDTDMASPSNFERPSSRPSSRPHSRRKTGVQSRLTVPRISLSQCESPEVVITPTTDVISVEPSLETPKRTEGRETKHSAGNDSNTASTPRRPISGDSTREKPITAKGEMLRLLQLYGVQTSDIYRGGFDASTLPPSGFWPDPLAHLRDPFGSACEDMDHFPDTFSELQYSRMSSNNRRRSSVLDLPTSSRRMSIVGGREGRKTSTMGGGMGCGRGRGMINPTLGKGIHPDVGRKVSVAADRRTSMITRPLMERPTLSRRNYSTVVSPNLNLSRS
ncbi:espin [Nematostella vectensis]|uniref:espin n=1 Tax=Nematostella vectensis TaxID=45351 RepID=UPI0020779340|nr:espin [Nematostella vectensis]